MEDKYRNECRRHKRGIEFSVVRARAISKSSFRPLGLFGPLGPLVALLLLRLSSLAQSPHPDFTGEWILDQEASKSEAFNQSHHILKSDIIRA